jgi:hypothetical protein
MVAASTNAMFHDAIPLVLKGRRATWSMPLKTFARRRLSRVLGPFAGRVRRVAVWLEDVNGPRGGEDKRCRIEVQLTRRGPVTVSGSATTEYAAIARAALRARRVLVRHLPKGQRKRHALTHPRRNPLSESNNGPPTTRGAKMYSNSATIPTLGRRWSSGPTVAIGSTVTIRDVATGECDVYTLVPPDDADVALGRISSMTPAGRALYGCRAGEVVEIFAPGGIVRATIEEVTSNHQL